MHIVSNVEGTLKPGLTALDVLTAGVCFTGAWTADIFTTLLASCRMVGVEPWEYLRDLFCLLPAWPAHRVLELAPAYWAGTREREDVVAMLAADPYRAATL